MEIRQFEPQYLEAAKSVLKEAFYREGCSPAFNEWEFARRLLTDPGYIPELCLLAMEGGEVIGYNALTTAWAGNGGLALGPLCVKAAWQGKGVGTALVEESLRRARQAGYGWVAVLGGAYYARFGFEPAGPYGLTVSENAFDNEHLQLLFLREDGAGPSGRLRYCGAFYDGDGNLL